MTPRSKALEKFEILLSGRSLPKLIKIFYRQITTRFELGKNNSVC